MRHSSARNRIAVLAIVGVAAVVLAWWIRREHEPVVDGSEIHPPGRWHFDPTELAEVPEDTDLARVLSLPYVAGKTPAPGHAGVLQHEPSLAFPGLNLYVSGHGPEARLVDMEGRLIHGIWRPPLLRPGFSWRPTAERSGPMART